MGKFRKLTWLSFGIIICPVIVALMMNIKSPIRLDTSNSWIGFYASYIGSIIGVVGVFVVMKLDQEKREQERKNLMFFNNLDSYKNLSTILSNEKIEDVYKKIQEFKNLESWNNVDTETKSKLTAIAIDISNVNEDSGYRSVLRSFINSNLYDQLKVESNTFIEKTREDVISEGIPDITIEGLTNILKSHSEGFRITVTKDMLLKKFENQSYISLYVDKFDEIYRLIMEFNESDELKKYENQRLIIESKIIKMADDINERIEFVLTY